MKNLKFISGLISIFLVTTNLYGDSNGPKTFSDLEKMSQSEMKSLPDYKWDLGKTAEGEALKGKSEIELILLKNSIYAQYGLRFSNSTLFNYFSTRSWYKPNKEKLVFNSFSPLSSKNIDTFSAQLAQLKSGGRSIASDIDDVAYQLLAMGFCTYPVGHDPMAGLIVFDVGGSAKVFNSVASQNSARAFVYEGGADQSYNGTGSILIDGFWSISRTGDTVRVLLTYSDETIKKWKLAPGTREVLKTDIHKFYGGDLASSHKCKSDVLKASSK